VGTLLAPGRADDVALLQGMLTLGGAERGLSAQDDEPLLVRVMQVVRAEPIARLELVHRPAEQLRPDVLADPGVPTRWRL
jgi:hypothetical protein